MTDADVTELRRLVEEASHPDMPCPSNASREVWDALPGLLDEYERLRGEKEQADATGAMWMARANACRAETAKALDAADVTVDQSMDLVRERGELQAEVERLRGERAGVADALIYMGFPPDMLGGGDCAAESRCVAKNRDKLCEIIDSKRTENDTLRARVADLEEGEDELKTNTLAAYARIQELEAALLAVRGTAQTYRSSDPFAFDEILNQAARALTGET